MDIQELKERVPLAMVLEDYGAELVGRGNRLRAKVNPIRDGGDFDVYQDTQKFYDQGTGNGGDVIDFTQTMENLDREAARSFLEEKYLRGSNTPTSRPLPRPRVKPVKKNNSFLLAELERKANIYLGAKIPKGTVNLNRLTDERYSVIDVMGVEVVRVAPVFEKLLEDYLIPTDEKYAVYLFNNVIGYDSYFNCPVIIIRDESENVVDIVRYRPHREGFTDLPKYLYSKGSEKPDSNYLFPLQAQMQLIMRDQGYCYVGEGLKNAINASLMGIPLISIESTGSIKPELIEFLQSDRMKGIVMMGAFDGDKAGECAYKKIGTEIPIENEFDFNSGMDFAEFLKEMRNELRQ